MQLAARWLPVAVLLSLVCVAPARAEQVPQNPQGEVVFRGNYWRDRNTRVINPTVDVSRDLRSVKVSAHYVLDAITSASIAAGAATDKPFTELRHEAGFAVEVPLTRRVAVSASYSYSSESDYWSHSAGVRLRLNLFQDNTTLLLGADYGHNVVAKRAGPTGYLVPPPVLSRLCMTPDHAGDDGCHGVLQTAHAVALLTQVFTPRLLGSLSYEFTANLGNQNNPYRPVFVSGERTEVENLPFVRYKHVLAGSLHSFVPLDSDFISHLTLRPGFRLFADSWGAVSLAPELATYVPLGRSFELRVLLSYLRHYPVDFYRSDDSGRKGYFPGTPSYARGPVEWDGDQVFTSDVKLGDYSTYTLDLQLKWRLHFLSALPGRLGDAASRTVLELSAGLWFADGGVGWQFGIPLSGGDPEAPAGCSQVCGAYFGALGLYVPL